MMKVSLTGCQAMLGHGEIKWNLFDVFGPPTPEKQCKFPGPLL